MPAKQPTRRSPAKAPAKLKAKAPAAPPKPRSAAARKEQAAKAAARLAVDYADAGCALHFTTPFQLLIATILSAQCTDVRVNMVTPVLFKKYPGPADFAKAPLPAIEKAVQSTGFFRNKAKNIKAASTAIERDHGGHVPRDLDALVVLPGVGRKTANVVLGTAFGLPTGVVVDTHVGRISRRLGLTSEDDPVKVEQDLMALLPKTEWINFAHRMIHHGRQICIARKPKCSECSMASFCPRIGVTSAA